MPILINSQRKLKVDRASISSVIEALLSLDEFRGNDFTVVLISDRRMKELNRFFRGKDSTTDVLSFPHEAEEFEMNAEDASVNFLGDIVISAEQADRQAAENGLTLENEIEQLILHGLLHLCGYDHETDDGEMNRLELKLRRKLGI